MAGEHGFDLERGDVLAYAADDVLQAIDEMQAAVGSAAHRVAGMEPALPPRLIGSHRVFEITREETAARIGCGLAHEQLAAFFDPHFCVITSKPNASRA